MNNEEKRSLLSFLSIYLLSSVFFMSIIGYMYFEREVSMLKEHCSMSMSKAAMEVKSDILQSYMNQIPYVFKANNQELNYAILTDHKKIFFSNLQKKIPKDLEQTAYHGQDRSLHILKLDDKKVDLKYIVVEDTTSIDLVTQLKYKIIFIFVVGLFIMLSIGFILTRILLKPVREKAEKLNRFVKDSSHELNTPITALMMIVANLKKQYKIDEKTTNQMVASTKYIKQTYDKLLFNINGDIVELYDEEFDLKEIVEQNILFVDEIAKSKEITLYSQVETCKVYMDKQSATMVVNNLISNAIKYTKKRKSISIELKKCKLLIKDEGIGISKELQESIFSRYKRATNEEGGFGIGLDIVSSVCKKYDIDITLDSIETKGSSFILDFSHCKLLGNQN
jgi:two-component system, OmpR family, sensor kinase